MGLLSEVKGVKARISADESLSYCVLESGPLTDEEAKAWWERVTQNLSGITP